MKKYVILMLAVVLAAGSAFTTLQPATKTVAKAKKTVEKKWFRFDGDPGEEMDASLYTVVSSPSCPSTTASYRCEIFIEAQVSDANHPDLSNAPTEERKKTNP
jgi:hypothetical protein